MGPLSAESDPRGSPSLNVHQTSEEIFPFSRNQLLNSSVTGIDDPDRVITQDGLHSSPHSNPTLDSPQSITITFDGLVRKTLGERKCVMTHLFVTLELPRNLEVGGLEHTLSELGE
jgi:hypothetical protein